MIYASNYFQGDPKLFLGPDGSWLQFEGGRVLQDQGLENLALISLFTKKGWCGNILFKNINEQIGSDFEVAHNQPINKQTLNDIRLAAEKALANSAFGTVVVSVKNERSNWITTTILIQHLGKDIKKLSVSKQGINWIAQIESPANTKELI